jgi:cation diffusion facilitator family transporter
MFEKSFAPFPKSESIELIMPETNSAEIHNIEIQSQGAARLSLLFNVVQTLIKFVAAMLTGSISLLSEALHSASDVVSSIISFVSIRASLSPPDEEHPYGHGKIDTLAGLSEAILLLLFAVYTGIMAGIHLFEKPKVQQVDFGILAATVCGVGAIFMMRFVQKVANQTGSLALRSSAQHYAADIVTTGGVLIALVVTKLTRWPYADPVFALILSAWLIFIALKMVHTSFHEAIDHRIEPAELDAIHKILARENDLHSFHKLRTRHSGSWHFVELHLVVPRDWSVVEGHELADRVEKSIEAQLSPCVCTIHVDPAPNPVIQS